jgi:hypothetical protein
MKPLLKTVLKPLLKTALIPILKTILKRILKYIKLLAAPLIIIIALAVTAMIFYKRPPVLIVTDAPFAALYGESRIRRQRIVSSIVMFRRVRPVITADGASPDIVVAAISGAAGRPYCVLFPGYLAQAAERFHAEFPETPAAILCGYGPSNNFPQPDGILCVYRTDLDTDLYRAGLFAGLLGLTKSPPEEAQRTCFLLQDRYIQGPEGEVFSKGVRESDPEAVARFANSVSDMPGSGVSCAVLTRAGAEYLDKNPEIPLILFAWLDPYMLPAETAAVFDDSTWALLVPAVQMAVNSQAEGKIPSKPLVFSGKTADNGIYRILRQLAKKTL